MRTVHKTLPGLIKKKSCSIIFWGNVSQHILILFTDYIAHSVILGKMVERDGGSSSAGTGGSKGVCADIHPHSHN